MKSLKINNQFILSRKIAQGSFGIVFSGYDQLNSVQVAVKLEKPENEQLRSLDKEVDILKRLDGVQGVPKLIYFGKEDECNVLVLQLLSKDLSSLIKKQKKFSLKTILQIAVQLVKVLEEIHKKGVLHRDLKPENIMIDDDNRFYLIDFGISKVYVKKNGTILPFKDRVPFAGTSRYASIAAHNGNELGRKDDLESLMYILLYLYFGQVPWQNVKNVPSDQKITTVGDLKMKKTQELLKELPQEFRKIYDYLRKLTYASEPDYQAIIKLFNTAAKKKQIVLDASYEWDIQVTTQTENFSRFGTLQLDDFQCEKMSSNYFINQSKVMTPQRQQQLHPPRKQDSNYSSYKSRNGSGNFSSLNQMGIIYKNSIDEISEDTEYIIPNESQSASTAQRIKTMPDLLKKPKQKYQQTINFDEEQDLDNSNRTLFDNYKKLQSLSFQLTSAVQNFQK